MKRIVVGQILCCFLPLSYLFSRISCYIILYDDDLKINDFAITMKHE